tara:strand:- start:307 stop:753 length:447 start_codon:yes stop_codon:yes gene_type:complete
LVQWRFTASTSLKSKKKRLHRLVHRVSLLRKAKLLKQRHLKETPDASLHRTQEASVGYGQEKNQKKEEVMARKQRRVPKDKATGLPKKYLSGAKNRAAKAREIKRTAEAYKAGEFIDIKAVSASRAKQGGTKKKTTNRRNKKGSKGKG